MKIILGIVGPIASGKTTVTDYIKERHGASTFRFSDMLRDILDRIHLPHSREHMQTLSTALRDGFGDDVMSRVLAKDVEKADEGIIITEGIRRPSDVSYLKDLPGFTLIALDVNERIRFERLTERSENPDDRGKTWEQFQKDGRQEPEQKIQEIAAVADVTIDNNGSMEELQQQIDAVLARL